MGRYITNILSIETDSIYPNGADLRDMLERITKIAQALIKEGEVIDFPSLEDDISCLQNAIVDCMSKELKAHKGNVVVLAGIFNYWQFERAEVFAKRIAKEFDTDVTLTSWDQDNEAIKCNAYGKDGEAVMGKYDDRDE